MPDVVELTSITEMQVAISLSDAGIERKTNESLSSCKHYLPFVGEVLFAGSRPERVTLLGNYRNPPYDLEGLWKKW